LFALQKGVSLEVKSRVPMVMLDDLPGGTAQSRDLQKPSRTGLILPSAGRYRGSGRLQEID
jgi:hypothetical protein